MSFTDYVAKNNSFIVLIAPTVTLEKLNTNPQACPLAPPKRISFTHSSLAPLPPPPTRKLAARSLIIFNIKRKGLLAIPFRDLPKKRFWYMYLYTDFATISSISTGPQRELSWYHTFLGYRVENNMKRDI